MYEGSEPWDAMQPIQEALQELKVSEDIELIVTFECGNPLLGLSPKTIFGKEVCDDLLARGDLEPCEMECSFTSQGECRRCGKLLVH
jgi:hypothetical protein